jgi:hypothetical protein
VLSTASEIIIASKRIRLSWFNAGWMLASLLFTCAWWIGLWDLHTMKTWSVDWIALNFSVAAGIYLQARLVSPRIAERGAIDLQDFHFEEGLKYLIAYAAASAESRHRSNGRRDHCCRDLREADLGARPGARDPDRRLDPVLRTTAAGANRRMTQWRKKHPSR